MRRPYSAICFRGTFFLRCPPCQVCLWIAIGHLYGKKWGCSSDSLRYLRKHSVTGVLLHLSRDRGGISVGSPSPKSTILTKTFTDRVKSTGEFFQQSTYGVVGEGVSAENSRNFPQNMFYCVRKGCILRKICGNL